MPSNLLTGSFIGQQAGAHEWQERGYYQINEIGLGLELIKKEKNQPPDL